MSPNKHKAMMMLSQGIKKKVVAKECDVCRATISTWLRCKDFQHDLGVLQKENLDFARDMLRDRATFAVETLIDIVESTNNESLKARICLKIIENSGIGLDLDDLLKYGWGIKKYPIA